MAHANPNARLEAFCDAVFAIAMTLLIIDVKLPAGLSIDSNADLWRALAALAPTMLAFGLSFFVILITWVNHHEAMKLIGKSSIPFMFANGLLLLTVVFLPFPTALLGDAVFTEHAAPAVVLMDVVLAAQGIGWVLMIHSALKNGLATNERAATILRANVMKGFGGFVLYGLGAVLAFWFPLTIAVLTALSWLFWLVLGIRLKTADAA